MSNARLQCARLPDADVSSRSVVVFKRNLRYLDFPAV